MAPESATTAAGQAAEAGPERRSPQSQYPAGACVRADRTPDAVGEGSEGHQHVLGPLIPDGRAYISYSTTSTTPIAKHGPTRGTTPKGVEFACVE